MWLIFFTAFGTTTIIVLLSPTLFGSSGLVLSTAALLVGLNNFGGAGMGAPGGLVERFAPLMLLPEFWLGAAILAIMGLVAPSAALSAVCMALLGLTVPLGASGGIALAAISYPTAIRSTGVGWPMRMGRSSGRSVAKRLSAPC